MVALPEPPTQLHRVAAAIEARLRLAFPSPMFDVALMPPLPTVKEFQRLTHRKPFLGIAWAGFKAAEKVGRTLHGDADWILYVVVDNPDTRRRFEGDSRGVGLWGMVSAAAFLLHGWTLDALGTASITAIDSLVKEEWGDETTAIAGIGLSIPLIPGAGFAADTLDDFLRLHCVWSMPAPEGSAEIPADTIQLGGG